MYQPFNRIIKKKVLKRFDIPLDEIILKSMFGGLNSYKKIDSNNVVHFLCFDPISVHFNKTVLKYVKIFLKLNELSLKFCYFKFKQHKILLKKTASIKKNLRKKSLKKLKKSDYGLITF